MGNSNEDIFNFENLKVYQKSLDYLDLIYEIIKEFPKVETYALTSQLIRASQSISLNIAEGSGESKAQFIRYLNISKGSLRECIVCIAIAKRRNYITIIQENDFRKQLIELSKMISGLISSLKNSYKPLQTHNSQLKTN
jgi:four helix bundle protein